MRSEHVDRRPAVQGEDPAARAVAHAGQEASHLREVLLEPARDRRLQEVDAVALERQGDRALVEQRQVARRQVGRPQQPAAIVVEHPRRDPLRNPAQGVDGDAQLVLLIVEQRLDRGVVRMVVAPLEAHRLQIGRADQRVVPTVVPGDGDGTPHRRRAAGRLYRAPHRGGRESVHDAAPEHVGAHVEARVGRQAEAAPRGQRIPNQSFVAGVEPAVAVDVGDPGGKQHALRRLGANGRARRRQARAGYRQRAGPQEGAAGTARPRPRRRLAEPGAGRRGRLKPLHSNARALRKEWRGRRDSNSRPPA